jgi:hypothetical protein
LPGFYNHKYARPHLVIAAGHSDLDKNSASLLRPALQNALNDESQVWSALSARIANDHTW